MAQNLKQLTGSSISVICEGDMGPQCPQIILSGDSVCTCIQFARFLRRRQRTSLEGMMPFGGD